MELADMFDISDEDEPTGERETYPAGSQLALELQRRIALWSHDELRALQVLVDKLEAGRFGKPPLDIVNDKRDWNAEKRSEAADLLWYVAFQAVREGAQ